MSATPAISRRNALAGFLILFAGVGLTAYTSNQDAVQARKAIVNSGRVVAVEGCNRDFDTVMSSRQSVVDLQTRLKDANAKGDLSNAAFKEYTALNAAQLGRLIPPDCRKVPKLLTDDPRKTKYPPPYPKYPGYNN